MKNGILLFLVGTMVLMQCAQGSEKTNILDLVDLESEIDKLKFLKEVEWPQAYREQDTVLLDRILGDDFQMVGNNGEWSDKVAQMNRIKAEPMNHDSFWYEIKRLEILENNTAIIAGTGHIVNRTEKAIYQSSNVLIYRNGQWKAVLSHVSGYTILN